MTAHPRKRRVPRWARWAGWLLLALCYVLSVFAIVLLKAIHHQSHVKSMQADALMYHLEPTPSDYELAKRMAAELKTIQPSDFKLRHSEGMRIGRSTTLSVTVDWTGIRSGVRRTIQTRNGTALSSPTQPPNIGVRLEAPDLQLEQVGSIEQVLLPGTTTEWRWTATPLQSGRVPVRIIGTIRVGPLSRDFVSVEETLAVRNSLAYRIARFWEPNWQWLTSSILFPLFAFIWGRMTRDRKRETRAAPDAA